MRSNASSICATDVAYEQRIWPSPPKPNILPGTTATFASTSSLSANSSDLNPVMNLDIPRLVLDGIQVVGSLVSTRQDLKEAFQFTAEGKVVPRVTLQNLKKSMILWKKWSKESSLVEWCSILRKKIKGRSSLFWTCSFLKCE